MEALLPKILPNGWEAWTNIEDHHNGRIIVGWNASQFHLRRVESSAQWITCEISNHHTFSGTRVTFVYGFNNYGDRNVLWDYIHRTSEENNFIPWAILGDFNAVMRPSDESGGAMDWRSHHEDFPNCIAQSGLHRGATNIGKSNVPFDFKIGQAKQTLQGQASLGLQSHISFERSLMHRNSRNAINRPQDRDGVVYTGREEMGDLAH
ncbi:hypothetical protein OIU84_021976 [Salix udensis]|uniref:Endonuclease/exonuclease/phosphatase domain-containing protein n=1 Tax=Salix udensis TaxID=889485 RepID=A0AAD6PHM9_9ROSI|nr:hypothetical protein OIU84_021976 [Salix udensis]